MFSGSKTIIYEDPFTTIPVEKLKVGSPLPFDVYVKDKSLIQPLFNKQTIFTESAKKILREKGITEVYIKREDSSYLTSSQVKPSVTIPPPNSPEFKEYSTLKERHYQIDKKLLIPGTELNFSLFRLNKLSIEPIIEIEKDSYALIDEKITNIKGDILIRSSDIPLYHEYLNSLQDLSKYHKEKDNLNLKILVIRENSKLLVRDLLDNPRSGEKIKEVKTLVNNTIECLLENKDAIYDLLSLENYDYYTYTHSVNVSVLSVGLGIEINLKREDVEKLGIGTMLHDIGKSAIPHEILNKQGKLSDKEYECIKKHVIEGINILKTHKDIPEESLNAVLHHHERLSGSGYPYRLKGDAIGLFGRISAITDSYDALTTQRPYKPAYTPFYALSLIVKQKDYFDCELLESFIKMLGKIG
ncbi:MAG: HD-GYP domain-containing protein [Thermodesulfovibrionales bacterium]